MKLPTLFKKLFLSFLVFVVLFSSFAPVFSPAHAADSTWYNQGPFDWYIKVYDENTSPSNEIFGERYTAAQVQWVFWSIFSTAFNLPFTLLGVSPGPSICVAKYMSGVGDVPDCILKIASFIKDVGGKMLSSQTHNNNSLAYGNGAKAIFKQIFSEDRPISAITYFKKIGRGLNLIPEARAAESFGFSRLSVIQNLWKMSRNAAYLIFTLTLIGVAFMIMFKVKISPQAVVTVQSAIPKILITLILITFSYAIAGFLIDLMYIFMGIFALFFKVPPLTSSPLAVFNFISGKSLGSFAIIVAFTLFLILYIVAILLTWLAALLFLNGGGLMFASILGIFTIILIILVVIDFFRIFYTLFKALAGFYFAVILGPLQLSLNALPQSGGVFGSWIKSMIGKLAVFPLTGILFYLANVFLLKAIQISAASIVSGNVIIQAVEWIFDRLGYPINIIIGGIDANKLWKAPMLANGQTASSIAFIFMALGALMIIPKIGEAIEAALAKRPFDYNTAMTESMKKVGTSIGGTIEGLTYKTPLQVIGQPIGVFLQQIFR